MKPSETVRLGSQELTQGDLLRIAGYLDLDTHWPRAQEPSDYSQMEDLVKAYNVAMRENRLDAFVAYLVQRDPVQRERMQRSLAQREEHSQPQDTFDLFP